MGPVPSTLARRRFAAGEVTVGRVPPAPSTLRRARASTGSRRSSVRAATTRCWPAPARASAAGAGSASTSADSASRSAPACSAGTRRTGLTHGCLPGRRASRPAPVDAARQCRAPTPLLRPSTRRAVLRPPPSELRGRVRLLPVRRPTAPAQQRPRRRLPRRARVLRAGSVSVVTTTGRARAC